VAGTPARAPRSVRRTTTIDQAWDDFGKPHVVTASGRDLLTRADSSTEVLDEARVRIEVGGAGSVASVALDPHHEGLRELVGAPARSGFRARVAELAPEHRARASVLHQLLDDVPLAMLIASYGLTREHPEWNIPPEAAHRLTDLCAGWAKGATMLDALGTTGIFPVPVGPPAPSLDNPDDPLGWHETPPMAARSVRRVRRLDVVAADPLVLEVYFRDSHQGADGTTDVLHEYTLDATLDPSTLVVRSSTARAHTLPWPECPGALASAARIVGHRPDELAELVATELVGTSTCSHLNDLLRSIAGVTTMAEALT
jgi:hypothetical protein